MSRLLRLMKSGRYLRAIRLRSLGHVPRSLHSSFAFQNQHRRQYNNSNNTENLLNRLRTGSITKSEVQKLIVQNDQMSSRSSLSNDGASINTLNSTITTHHTAYSPNTNNSPIGGISPNNTNGSSIGGTITLGSKTNPVYMKKQTTFREFIFSLFPFLFIFWMLGGFDILKSRKQGGPGGMFGKNYSEWDETDWEDEDDEIEDENENENELNPNKQLNKNENESEEEDDEDVDPRTAFFRRLGIDVKEDDENKENEDLTDKDKKKSLNNNKKKKQQTQMDSKKNDDPTSKKKRKQKRVRFKDVCGAEEAKLDLQDLVDYLKNPDKYKKMGCKLPKGVLMSGQPGTGKTLLARALAGEAGVPFLATNGASFDEIFVGVGVMRVRKLFERAKERAPCIVFIDEIDAIANTRMQMGTAHSSDSLNALLSEMDGFERNTGIIVIAATNMPERLDAALIRPGRFDRKVQIQLPDKNARKEIVELYLKDRGDNDVDVGLLVSDVSGFSGAELESMVNLASIECVKQGLNKVNMEHLIEAKEIISMGRARRSLDISETVKQVTAYHEGGHAIVSLFTKGSKPIYKATILPRGPALGFVASSNEDEFMATKESLLAQMDVCMGGRAAEEIFRGNKNITTGASSDFHQATNIATSMVCQYGMSPKVGKVFYRPEDVPKLSPQLQNVINLEVRRLLDESYHRAQALIHDHRNDLDSLAKALLEKETLNGEEIKKIVEWNESRVREPIDFIMSESDKTILNGQSYNNIYNQYNRMIRNNKNNNNNNNGNDNGRSNPPNGGNRNNKKSKEIKDKLKANGGLIKPETDLLNPQPSMFIKTEYEFESKTKPQSSTSSNIKPIPNDC